MAVDRIFGPAPVELTPKSLKIGVYNETDPLKIVALWGPPGPETVLAQFLPPEINLFYSQFDITGAREEYMRMIGALKQGGVSVILIQDLLAETITPATINSSYKNIDRIPQSIKDLTTDLTDKGHRLHAQYGRRYGDLTQLDLLPQLLADDAQRLGEDKAVLLNWALSLRHELPSGDIFYGRDQTNVLGDMLVLSRMRWPIRKPEVGYWAQALRPAIGESNVYRPHGGRNVYLEGGDGIMMQGDVFLGVGGRTNFAGAAEVYRAVEPYLNMDKKHLYLVADEKAEQAIYFQTKPEEEQKVMHLDTFWMPFGDGRQVVACGEDVEQRVVYEVRRGGDNNHITLDAIDQFPGFMDSRGVRLCDIPKKEQATYATNFLNLDPNTVLVPFSSNEVTMDHFQRFGLNVIPIEIYALSGGYGAIHCMTSALLRKK